MLMVDFEKLNIADITEYLTVDIVLDWNPSFLDEPFKFFKESLAKKVEHELDKHLLKKPVLFRFITRFENNDLDLIVDNLTDAVINYMIAGPREREPRLGRPKELEQVVMLNGTIMDCVNSRLDCDVFSIEILNKYDEVFFSIMEVINQNTLVEA